MAADTLLDNQVTALIEQIEVVHDREAVLGALRTFTCASGFQHYAYVCTGDGEVFSSDYPVDWKQAYVEQNLKLTDPVMRMARQTMQPFNWSAKNRVLNGVDDTAFFDVAACHGIASGFSIPISPGYGRFAMLTIASSDPDAAGRVAVRSPTLAATAVAFVHLSLFKALRASADGPKARLSGREATSLTWSSYGKSAPEIAPLMGISENTVRFHLVQARDKLGAANINHAIRIAVEQGLI